MTRKRHGKLRCAVIVGTIVLFSARNFLLGNHNDSLHQMLLSGSPSVSNGKQGIKPEKYLEEYPVSMEKWRNKVSTGVHLGANRLIETPKVMKQDDIIDTAGYSAVHYHAIAVPYRNREYHLKDFKQRMHDYIEHHYNKNNTEISLWIIEQNDTEPFNRGWLANVAIAEIIRHSPEVECLTFHDVDLIPDVQSSEVKGSVYYNNCSVPTQVGSELFRRNLNWTIGYKEYTGGVVNMHLQHWKAINGFSNDYISWGGEDDDLYLRLHNKGLLSVNRERKRLIRRPPIGYGRFYSLSESKEHHTQDHDKAKNENYNVSQKILGRFKEVPERSNSDGLSDLQYKITQHQLVEEKQGFTNIHHVKVKQQLLEFVPIPNTPGNKLIEQAAARIGIPWGSCHFEQRENYDRDEMDCPSPFDFANIGLYSDYGDELWLIPPHLWSINMFQGKHTFTIVRNPFDLMISKFYDLVHTEEEGVQYSEHALNEFLQRELCQATASAETRYLQHDYVFYAGIQNMPAILKLQDLNWAFADLMRHYELPIEVDPEAVYTLTTFPDRMDIQNLTMLSKQLVQAYFKEDFRRFNYSLAIVDRPDDKMPKGTATICNSALYPVNKAKP